LSFYHFVNDNYVNKKSKLSFPHLTTNLKQGT
jgi:hypothetical protein